MCIDTVIAVNNTNATTKCVITEPTIWGNLGPTIIRATDLKLIHFKRNSSELIPFVHFNRQTTQEAVMEDFNIIQTGYLQTRIDNLDPPPSPEA